MCPYKSYPGATRRRGGKNERGFRLMHGEATNSADDTQISSLSLMFDVTCIRLTRLFRLSGLDSLLEVAC